MSFSLTQQEREERLAKENQGPTQAPLNIHAWVGIAIRGSADIVMFTGVLTAMKYAKILDAALVPSAGSQ